MSPLPGRSRKYEPRCRAAAGRRFGPRAQALADLLAALLLEQLDRDAALQDLVGRRIDRPHAPPAQLLLQQKPLIERRANADHRGTPTARAQTIPVTLM